MSDPVPAPLASALTADRAQLAGRLRALLACPMAVVAIVDSPGCWWSSVAAAETEDPDSLSDTAGRALALQILLHRQPWHVSDTLCDPVLRLHPHVLGAPWFRSLAGVPLIDADGRILGCLCGLAHDPAAFGAEILEQLGALAAELSRSLEQQRLERGLRDLNGAAVPLGDRAAAISPFVGREALLAGLEALFRMRAAEGFSVLRLKCRDLDQYGTTLSPQRAQALLGAVADRIGQLLPPLASACRYNEEEFLLLLPGLSDQAELARLAERLIAIVSAPCPIGTTSLPLKVVVGGTVVDGSQSSLEAVLSEAASARRLAAAGGASGFRLIDADVRRQFRDDFARQSRFREALQQGSLQPFFQPIVDLVTGRPLGFEALARWCGADGRVQTPADFLPVASRMGLTAELDLTVLGRVLEALPRFATAAAGLTSEEEPLLMSVNLSAQLLDDQVQRQRLLALLGSQQITPGWRLQVEILEESLQDSSLAFDGFLSGLAALQVGIAIDDFGTGYSSLARLDHLPIQSFKIDRSFVERIDHHLMPSNHLLRMLNSLAIEMGLATTAEGVSTAAQRTWLQRSGFVSCQGYLFARPMPLPEALDYLQAANAADGTPASEAGATTAEAGAVRRRLRRVASWFGPSEPPGR